MADGDGVRPARCVHVRIPASEVSDTILTFHAPKRSQTPDLNTKPIIEAVVACVKRGIEVTLYITVGYNDAVRGYCFFGIGFIAKQGLRRFLPRRERRCPIKVARTRR